MLDLASDLVSMAELTDAKLTSRLKRSPKPIRKLKANNAPFLFSLEDMPIHLQQKLPSEKIVSERLSWLDANPSFVSRALEMYKNLQEDYEPAHYLEQRIHESFLTAIDEEILEEFHAAPWEERLPIIERLGDERYKLLGHRLIHRERPDVLPHSIRLALDKEIYIRLMGTEIGGEPWLTLPKALEQTNDLLVNAQGEERALLSELAEYLTLRLEDLAA